MFWSMPIYSDEALCQVEKGQLILLFDKSDLEGIAACLALEGLPFEQKSQAFHNWYNYELANEYHEMMIVTHGSLGL